MNKKVALIFRRVRSIKTIGVKLRREPRPGAPAIGRERSVEHSAEVSG
ncbi:MAG: hypothetical protein NT075_32550 [Chloroflexi bacterium]|nr:hypothetical protein [Chloroflexota bacterium]